MGFKTLVLSLALAGLIKSVLLCAPEGESCDLPNCRCPGFDIPGGFRPEEIPQIVTITFDDAVSVMNYPLYEDLIFPLKNPNGYPISATFYVTQEYNNYTALHDLWRKGHEIGLHSMSHKPDIDYWRNLNHTGWEHEVADQRGQVAYFAQFDMSYIKGFRAPFLQTGGDTMMEVLYDTGLQYDCSRPTRNFIDPGLWPYTADYDQNFQDCQIAPCSVGSYPGFWIVPMLDFIGLNGEPCAMLDTCVPVPQTVEDTLDLLKLNFERQYLGNRAPFGVHTHSAWLLGENEPARNRLEGYRQFLEYLTSLPDVYLVSVTKAIEWIKSPTKLDDLDTFEPWKHEADHPDACRAKYNCHFRPEDTPFGSERYMMICRTCPIKYPWLGNPYGLNT